ncbi:MAG: acetylornithine deacetylase, partial [Hyphomicrobiales bacterium]
MITSTHDILDKLIAFPTVSRESNLDLIDWVQGFLNQYGVSSSLTHNDEGTKANLHAVIGPQEVPGVMLSGHTDVVPVDGQDWLFDPFALSHADGRYFGRGTADMKGFIASALAMVPRATKANLKRPIHLALSYDEEIGCIGVRRMIDVLEDAPVTPAFCIVGEPTEMLPAIGHKGKTGMECVCRGVESHSALVTDGLNAIYLATEMISAIREIHERIRREGVRDMDYPVPWTTLHVGTISGGTALNIVPNECRFKFEIRNLSADDPMDIVAQLRAEAEAIAKRYRDKFPAADVAIEIFNEYPALDTGPEDEIVAFVKSLTGANAHTKVAFGTEGGLFQKRLGMPVVVCGPGSMQQGHKPDEFIAESELAKCDQFLANLVERLTLD